MGFGAIGSVTEVIDYVEGHLNENLDLETVADAVHYSRYHLHRMFTDTVGLTSCWSIRKNLSLRSRILRAMKASRHLPPSSRPCISRRLWSIGRRRVSIPYS